MGKLAILAGLVILAQEPAATTSETVTVHRTWTGDTTLIDKAEYQRITDTDAWTTLWRRHAGKRERVPEVDFDKHMVIAVFLGRVTYDHAAVHAVKKTKDELVFGLELEEGDCCDLSTRPLYLIAVVPRSNLKLSIISRVRNGTDVDPREDKVLKEFAKID